MGLKLLDANFLQGVRCRVCAAVGIPHTLPAVLPLTAHERRAKHTDNLIHSGAINPVAQRPPPPTRAPTATQCLPAAQALVRRRRGLLLRLEFDRHAVHLQVGRLSSLHRASSCGVGGRGRLLCRPRHRLHVTTCRSWEPTTQSLVWVL